MAGPSPGHANDQFASPTSPVLIGIEPNPGPSKSSSAIGFRRRLAGSNEGEPPYPEENRSVRSSRREQRRIHQVRVATFNVRSLQRSGYGDLLAAQLESMRIDVCAIQEHRLAHPSPRYGKYTSFLCPSPDRTRGVGFLIREDRVQLVSFHPITQDIAAVTVRHRATGRTLHMTAVYAPHSFNAPSTLEKFWDSVAELPACDVLLGDWNVGTSSTLNASRLAGETELRGLSDLALKFRKPWRRRWTFQANALHRNRCSRIDRIFVADQRQFHDCSAVAPPMFPSDHRLLRATWWPTKSHSFHQQQTQSARGPRFTRRCGPPEVEEADCLFRTSASRLQPVSSSSAQNRYLPTDRLNRARDEAAARIEATNSGCPFLALEAEEVRGRNNTTNSEAFSREWLTYIEEVQSTLNRCPSKGVAMISRRVSRRRHWHRKFSLEEANDCAQYFAKLYQPKDEVRPPPTLLAPAPRPPTHPPASTQVVAYPDGGCTNPTDPTARRSAWAAVIHVHCPNGTIEEHLYSGRTWGEQTAGRGEVIGLCAVLAMSPPGSKVLIHQDNLGCVHRLSNGPGTYVDGNFADTTHEDIWREVFRLVPRFTSVEIRHVPSHSGADTLEKKGNQRADDLCTEALRTYTAACPITHTPAPWFPLSDAASLPWYGADDSVPTVAEILAALAAATDSAPGPDGVRKCHVANAECKDHLIALVQSIWKHRAVPRSFSVETLIALPKVAQPKDWSEYRGIMLQAFAAKVLVRVILDRLRGARRAAWQYGFRRGRSTTDAIAALKLAFGQRRKRNEGFSVCFVDLVKAFDSVPREALFGLLDSSGLGPSAVAILRDLYDEEAYVRLGAVSSTPFSVRCGVRQGCPLSPTLFGLFLEAALCEWSDSHPGIFLLGYADDLVFGCRTTARLQAALTDMDDVLRRYGLQISLTKTKWMRLNPRQVKQKAMARTHEKLNAAKGTGRSTTLTEPTPGSFFLQHTAGTRTKCPFCDYATEQGCHLRAHIRSQHDMEVQVGAKYVERRATIDVPDDFRCRECGKQYAARLSYRQHKYLGRCHGTSTSVEPPQQGVKIICGAPTSRKGTCKNLATSATQGCRYHSSHSPLPNQTSAAPPPIEPDPEVPEPPHVILRGARIEKVQAFRYLGRIISDDDSDHSAVEHRLKAARLTFGRLVRKCFFRRELDQQLKLHIFQTFCMPVLLYGLETCVLSKNDLAKLRRFQFRGLRFCTGLHIQVTHGNEGQKIFQYPPNASVRARVGGAFRDVEVQLVQHRIRYYGHVLRRRAGTIAADRRDPLCQELANAQAEALKPAATPGFKSVSLLYENWESARRTTHLSIEDAEDRGKWRLATKQIGVSTPLPGI